MAEGDLQLFNPANEPSDIAAAYLRYVGTFDDPEQVQLGVVPPFTTLDRRQGPWQQRSQQWKNLGIEGELAAEGREQAQGTFRSIDSITDASDAHQVLDARTGTMRTVSAYGKDALADTPVSIFDPLLCELTYRWFCPAGGVVLDPFAGGAVRGIVAGSLGRPYVGMDLNPRQVEANVAQRERIMDASARHQAQPIWVADDSRNISAGLDDLDPDLVFTCPPYGDLEVYSDDPRDLSVMAPAEFDQVYTEILERTAGLLRPDRFCVLVVGNYRDKAGHLRDLVGLTVRALESAGLRYYNEAVILDPIGTAAVRAPRQFAAQRKLVRVHQSYLVFIKGNAKAATAAIREAS